MVQCTAISIKFRVTSWRIMDNLSSLKVNWSLLSENGLQAVPPAVEMMNLLCYKCASYIPAPSQLLYLLKHRNNNNQQLSLRVQQTYKCPGLPFRIPSGTRGSLWCVGFWMSHTFVGSIGSTNQIARLTEDVHHPLLGNPGGRWVDKCSKREDLQTDLLMDSWFLNVEGSANTSAAHISLSSMALSSYHPRGRKKSSSHNHKEGYLSHNQVLQGKPTQAVMKLLWSPAGPMARPRNMMANIHLPFRCGLMCCVL